jgi:hypothetical protein
MGWELREGSGSLFKNERRNNEKHPHMTGTCMIDGKVYYISAWTKEGASGRFQSLAFKLKDDDHDGDYDNRGNRDGHSGSGGRGNSSGNRGGTGRANPNGNRQGSHQDFPEDDDIPF